MFEQLCDEAPPPREDPSLYWAWIDDMTKVWHQALKAPTEQSRGWIEAIRAGQRMESQAAAAQLMAIGELFAYRLRRHGETEDWALDTMDGVAAEVAAGLKISQRGALDKVRIARDMRERLPQTAAVFCAGEITLGAFVQVTHRTSLITDPDILARVDRAIAAHITRWPSLTPSRLSNKVDAIIAQVDIDAVRRREKRHTERHLDIGDPYDGLCPIEGQLRPTDARALSQTLTALAATVCPHDPRTPEQRRADAIEALTARATRMSCLCRRTDCTAPTRRPASPVTIHVIAPHDALTNGSSSTAPAAMIGAADGLITPELLADLAVSATIVPLIHPGYTAPEPTYRPSAALADFIRARDLTCRWPGCEVPADRSDLDHTIPWSQGGPTHAANIKCLCRTHHLVKTFWGWTEKQLPDGTLILTSPSGDTHITTPGSALLFPTLCTTVGGMPTPETDTSTDYCSERTAMMPTRRRTRTQNRAHRIATERRANHNARTTTHTTNWTDWTHWADNHPPPHPDDDPPPF